MRMTGGEGENTMHLCFSLVMVHLPQQPARTLAHCELNSGAPSPPVRSSPHAEKLNTCMNRAT